MRACKLADGFLSSVSKFKNNTTKLLDKTHITEAVCVSEQPFSRKLQGEEIAAGRHQNLDVHSPTCGFSSPTNAVLFADLHTQRIFAVVF